MSAKKVICFLVLLSACAYGINATKEPVVPSYSSNQFSIVLHSDRDKYSIGESIRLKLQMLNRGTEPVTITGGFVFDWTRLAFSSPHAIHLLNPHSEDLLRPFYRPSPQAETPPVTVAGGGEEWIYLPLTTHLHLQEPGNYSFWIELGDTRGILHQSNRINFSLEDVEYSVASDLVELSLRSRKLSWAPTERIEIEAVFHNKSSQEIIFLKPQEDSFDGWINPVYLFSVTDSEGRGLALAQRCGTTAPPTYDENASFRVQPGESFTQNLPLPMFPEMEHPGKYQVRLSYIVRNKAIGKAGEVLDKPMSWEPEVFIGRIVSNELLLTIQ